MQTDTIECPKCGRDITTDVDRTVTDVQVECRRCGLEGIVAIEADGYLSWIEYEECA